MTKSEILVMKPGTELSMEVAEKVMGNVTTKDATWGHMERLIDPTDGSSLWVPLSAYSEDISAAESVVQTMLEVGFADAIHWAGFGGGKYTEPEAICKAALVAVAEGLVACEKH